MTQAPAPAAAPASPEPPSPSAPATPRSTRNKEQATRSHLSSADARVQPSSSDRSSSKRVFLQVDKADPSNAFWSQASPAEVINAG